MKRAITPKKHPAAEPERDDLLGKNHSRRSSGSTPGEIPGDEQPYRKRTEDLDDSL